MEYYITIIVDIIANILKLKAFVQFMFLFVRNFHVMQTFCLS